MKVYYDQRQSTGSNESMSPSAGKPRLVVEDWMRRQLPIELAPVTPVDASQLQLVHDPDYVEGVLDGRLHNGFGNCLMSVARTLPWTCGSLLSAAEYALASGESVCSPTSGFHHAGYLGGGGFCTFNALALVVLLFARGGHQVGIVDFDEHYGDGTQELLERFEGAGITGPVPHLSLGGIESVSEDPDQWLDSLSNELEGSFRDCSLVLYQAGADSHVDDPLGGTFDTVQFQKRDRIVFRTFRDLGIPVVWNLAGGYQVPVDKVLELHALTALTFIQVFSSDPE